VVGIGVSNSTRVLFIVGSYQIQMFGFISCCKFMPITFYPVIFGCITAIGIGFAIKVVRSLESFSGKLKFELRKIDRTAIVIPENLF
jgi:hypothetical protein